MTPATAEPRLRRLRTAELSAAEIDAIRRLLESAFGTDPEECFTDEDWEHALGGLHFVLDLHGEIVAHASVVGRVIHVDGRSLHAGYVEAVATAPAYQRRGLGTRVMLEVGRYIANGFELGALGTGELPFYERLGWLTWSGPSSVRAATGERRTPDEDGHIMILPTRTSPTFDPNAPISCDWRAGDVW